MKILTRAEFLPILLIVFAFAIGFWVSADLPELVPSHWDISGNVDGYATRDVAVLLLPAIALVVYLLMTFLPLIDPLKKRYAEFVWPYFWIKTVIVTFLVAIHLGTLWIGLGKELNMSYLIVFLMSALFLILGFNLPKIKKNYFIGIRTPWTLHSESVWDETHKQASKLFMIASAVSLLALIFNFYPFLVLIISILIAALFSVVYSYLVFKK